MNSMKNNENTRSPDYSSYAKQYAQSRPGYPEELFKYLSTLVAGHNFAWDCATGNGQAALSLTKYFKRVFATDISSEQIKCAFIHNQIEYKVCVAESSGLKADAADLITVASAIHWFDLDSFYKEVVRVLHKGGILAAWTYHVCYIEPPFEELFLRFYRDILSKYFFQGAKLVDEKYSTLVLPGEQIETGDFFISVNWKLDNMLDFIESWSGTQKYTKENGKNPVDFIEAELRNIWGNPETVYNLRWPLFIKISRI